MASFIPQAAAAAIPFILSLFQSSRQPKLEQIPTISGAQQDLLDRLLADILGGGGRFGIGGELFEQGFVQPAIANFENRIAPSIRGQFSSRGVSGGKLEADAIARAGRQVEQDIISQAARQQQALIGQALGTRGTQPQFIREQQGPIERALEPLAPIGAQAGADLLNQILNMFGPQGAAAPASGIGGSRVGFRG